MKKQSLQQELERSEHEEIVENMSDYLSDDAELEMVKRGDHKEIMEYIPLCYLSETAEVALMRRGNHDEIMLYLENYSLCDKAEAVVLERGNEEEIASL